jgi:hypothetical protein
MIAEDRDVVLNTLGGIHDQHALGDGDFYTINRQRD